MSEVSGPQWCPRFPTSASLDDLTAAFGRAAKALISAIKSGGATVSVAATYRPAERAYLMHWCCQIADGQVKPADAPAMAGVAIDWTHGGNAEAAHTAAILMKHEYGIAYPAALVSRHTQRLAIDMTVHWAGTIHVTDARGAIQAVSRQEDLWPIGATYGVHKLPSDPPHWSSDGH